MTLTLTASVEAHQRPARASTASKRGSGSPGRCGTRRRAGNARQGHPMNTYPSVDESRDRLHRAGWSVGEIATATRWLICGTNGENAIKAEAPGRRRHGGVRANWRPPWGCWRRRSRKLAGNAAPSSPDGRVP
jgi:hypothetical protein